MNDDRLGRIEKIMEEMAARQQYHDEARERLDAAGKANTDGLARLETHMAKLADTMDRLANIVIRHEERLDRLEDGTSS